jgi:hypothetical protein
MTKPIRSIIGAGFIALIMIAGVIRLAGATSPDQSQQPSGVLPHPILFVTHTPTRDDVNTVVNTFNNHLGGVRNAGRGGDLWIMYTDGTSRNLTSAAGYGNSGFQGANSIAVRDPAVYWDGTKALFSMVIGAPTSPSQVITPVWQIYQVTGFLNPSGPITITRIAQQPITYNNISPIYGTDDRIIFTSDIPPTGSKIYPELDEYNEFQTNTGLWSLDPVTGDLFQIDVSPSGDFSPSIDSSGRLIFVRWDHLERDQQADADAIFHPSNCQFCTFNYSSEALTATKLYTNAEIYPEPRPQRVDLLAGGIITGHHMNEFIPWTVNEDGTGAEAINHIGRHELLAHIPQTFLNDPNLHPLNPAAMFNQNRIEKFIQLREDAHQPGTYFGIDLRERTHGSGQIISLTGALGLDADQMSITYITHRETFSTSSPSGLPNSTGHYRDPLPMTNGTLIAAHTWITYFDAAPVNSALLYSPFAFRLKVLGQSGPYWSPVQTLTAGISKTVSFYYSPTLLLSYSGNQWELQPVEVVSRTRPIAAPSSVPNPEQQVFTQTNVAILQLQQWMKQNNLALAVSRNVTTRDDADQQQPYRLHAGTWLTGAQTLTGTGKIYTVTLMQFMQADQIRGVNITNTVPGRRVLPQVLHDPAAIAANIPISNWIGSSMIMPDGSMAMFVPARKPVSWQLIDNANTSIVRERFWLTFQPGEIRVCTSCHGLNEKDQAGNTAPQNQPQALAALLNYWKGQNQSALPPTILSGLNVTGTVGIPFNYAVNVTGTLPITITTSALPSWASLVGASIIGTPDVAATSNVVITATNSTGHDTKSLTIDIFAHYDVFLPLVLK